MTLKTHPTHTPGPWTIAKCPCGHRACDQWILSSQGTVGFTIDDARLIAAAPDLLAALEWLRDWYDENGPHTTDSDARISLADAAIAKARGRA